MPRHGSAPITFMTLAIVMGLAGTHVVHAEPGSELNQFGELVDPDGATYDRFGWSVATSTDFLVVSSPVKPEPPFGSGSVFVFDRATGEYIRKTRPMAEGEPPSFFGYAIAAWENLLAATELGSYPNLGSVFVFDLAARDQLIRIPQPDGTDSDKFGASVDLCGDRLVVGAPNHGPVSSRSGAAYLFDSASGELISKLTPENPGTRDSFGASVAITDSFVVVGAPFEEEEGEWDTGAVHIFDARTGSRLRRLRPAEGSADWVIKFGDAVAACGNLAVIGAPETFDGAQSNGVAFLFDLTTGQELELWRASDFDHFDGFGDHVVLDGRYALIGAQGADTVKPNLNRAYIFDTITGAEVATLYPKDGEASTDFGSRVELAGNQAVVTAPVDNGDADKSGRDNLFDLSPLFGCAGDLNSDGLINLADLNLVLANFGQTGDVGDATGDGVVDLADLNAVLASFGGSCD